MKFDPPALQTDFDGPQMAAWDVLISSWMDREAAGVAPPDGQGLFFNPARDSTPGSPATQATHWDAFPLFIREWLRGDPSADTKRWTAAETLRPLGECRVVVNGQLGAELPVFHRQQDEYCEWFAERGADGKIRKLAFTAEGPEYWEFIASGTRPFFNDGDPRKDLVPGNPAQLVRLYQTLLGNPAIVADDLYWQTDVAIFDEGQQQWTLFAQKGDYNRYNTWNTTHGAVHLTHPANTLGAEVNLAARATVLRSDGAGQPITAAQPLICCSGYGSVMRSSDPTIGSFVNTLGRQGYSVTLANPVGLYISELLPGIEGKNGVDVSSAWKVIRGTPDTRMVLRAVFEVEAALGFTVGDCKVAGKTIEFGSQIADQIKMTLTGAAKKLSSGPFQTRRCQRHCCTHPAKPTVKEVFEASTSCASLPEEAWTRLAPVMPPAAPHALAAVPAKPAPVEVPIHPKPAYSPTRSM